ncbi:MAG: PAS domain S-box protein, partial [Sphingobacteriales bacterium]
MQFTDENDLYNMVQHAPIGICILDAVTLVSELVNDKFLEIAGKPHEAIIGKYYWEPFAEVKPQYEAALNGVIQTGQAYYASEVEMALIRHGREEFVFVTFVYNPIKDKNGKVGKIAVWVLENTQQVKARQEINGLNEQLAEANDEMQTANASLSALNTRLQESETDFIRLVEQAPVAILVFRGPDMVIDQVNQAMLEILGKDKSIIGRPLLEGLPEIEGAPAVDQLFQVFHTGEPSDGLEEPVPIMTNGQVETRYFNFSYRPLLDNGRIIGVMDVAVEVTAQVLAREEVERQKRVYETITSGTPDLMYVWDLDYKFTYVNSALLTMWGKTWDAAIGKGLRENGYEEWHAQMHEREIDHVAATKESVRGEVAFPHAILGKRIYDYILIPVLNDQGEVEAVAGTTRDVTERKQLEEALARSSEEFQAINEEMAVVNEEQAASNEELAATNQELAEVNQQLRDARQKIEESDTALRLAIEAANFGTWFIHSGTRQFITDARLKQLFGYYPDEDLSIEQAIAQINDDYREFVSTKLENAIYHGGDYDVTYPVTGLHDGQIRWLRAVGNLKADPSGAFSAFTGVVMDVTEQHHDEQRKNDFIGMVSHELKTPLTSLTAIIQITNNKLKN